MAKRYVGDAVVEIEYVGQSGDGRSTYEGVVSVGPHKWPFDELHSGVGYLGDTPEAFDEMAASAISFASYYTSDNRDDDEEDSDTPEWAPPAEVADAISDATGWAQNDQGSYKVRRSPKGQGRYAGEAQEQVEEPRRRNPMLRARPATEVRSAGGPYVVHVITHGHGGAPVSHAPAEQFDSVRAARAHGAALDRTVPASAEISIGDRHGNKLEILNRRSGQWHVQPRRR